ncbi:MAG: tetratricopeptide repeat protein [Vulcanimicrobiota bacterium]
MVCNDWERTLAGLEQSLRDDPQDSATCRRLADAYAVRGRLKDTVSTYLHLSDILQSSGDLESALQISGLVLQLQPDSEAARLRRIHLFERRQQLDQCLKAYRELALLYLDQGRGSQAIDLLQRARRSHPDNLELSLELAETHVSEGHISQALGLFNQVAEALLQCGERERATLALRRMKILNPNDTSVLLQLGKLYLELDRLSEAEQELRGVLRQCLNHEEALMWLGQVCQRKGQGRDASLAFNRLLSLNPECWEAHHRLAQVLHGQGMSAEAVHNYLAAGEGYLAQGQRELAILPLRQLLALDPTHSTAICHLANLGASLEPEECLPPAIASEIQEVEPSSPSGELRRELKRRTLPGQEAKQALFKPKPGSRPGPKMILTKPVLVKASLDETPLFMQSVTAQSELPDFQGSCDWLLEEADQFPDLDGSCEWLATPLMSLVEMGWGELDLNIPRHICSSTGWPGQVWTQSGFGKLSHELTFWAQVAAENPDMWQARAEWAELSLKLGLCDQAIVLYREVISMLGESEDMRHRLIQALIWNDQHKEAAEACLELAGLYQQRQDCAQAVETLQLLLQLEPHHLQARELLAQLTTGKVSRHHLEILAEQASQQQHWRLAARACNQLLELDSQQTSARHGLMRAAAELGNLAEAARQARLLLEHYSQAADWKLACEVCGQLMQWERGHTRLWLKLLQECGDQAQLSAARVQLAEELVQDGQVDAAVSLLAEDSLNDRGAAFRLLDLLILNQDERALTVGVRLLEEDLLANRAQPAEQLCLRLQQSYPQSPELRCCLGRIYQAQGLWEEALQQFQLARRQPAWLHKATHALALCLMQRQGMEEVALRQVERALQVPGKSEELEALRLLLSR